MLKNNKTKINRIYSLNVGKIRGVVLLNLNKTNFLTWSSGKGKGTLTDKGFIIALSPKLKLKKSKNNCYEHYNVMLDSSTNKMNTNKTNINKETKTELFNVFQFDNDQFIKSNYQSALIVSYSNTFYEGNLLSITYLDENVNEPSTKQEQLIKRTYIATPNIDTEKKIVQQLQDGVLVNYSIQDIINEITSNSNLCTQTEEERSIEITNENENTSLLTRKEKNKNIFFFGTREEINKELLLGINPDPSTLIKLKLKEVLSKIKLSSEETDSMKESYESIKIDLKDIYESIKKDPENNKNILALFKNIFLLEENLETIINNNNKITLQNTSSNIENEIYTYFKLLENELEKFEEKVANERSLIEEIKRIEIEYKDKDKELKKISSTILIKEEKIKYLSGLKNDLSIEKLSNVIEKNTKVYEDIYTEITILSEIKKNTEENKNKLQSLEKNISTTSKDLENLKMESDKNNLKMDDFDANGKTYIYIIKENEEKEQELKSSLKDLIQNKENLSNKESLQQNVIDNINKHINLNKKDLKTNSEEKKKLKGNLETLIKEIKDIDKNIENLENQKETYENTQNPNLQKIRYFILKNNLTNLLGEVEVNIVFTSLFNKFIDYLINKKYYIEPTNYNTYNIETIPTLNNKKDTIKTEIGEVETKIEETAEEIKKIETKIKEMEDRTTLEVELNSIKKEFNSIKNEIKEVETKIEGTIKEIRKTEIALVKLGNIDIIKENQNRFNKKIEEKNIALTNLKSDIDKCNKIKTDLENSSKLNQKELKEKIDSLKRKQQELTLDSDKNQKNISKINNIIKESKLFNETEDASKLNLEEIKNRLNYDKETYVNNEYNPIVSSLKTLEEDIQSSKLDLNNIEIEKNKIYRMKSELDRIKKNDFFHIIEDVQEPGSVSKLTNNYLNKNLTIEEITNSIDEGFIKYKKMEDLLTNINSLMKDNAAEEIDFSEEKSIADKYIKIEEKINTLINDINVEEEQKKHLQEIFSSNVLNKLVTINRQLTSKISDNIKNATKNIAKITKRESGNYEVNVRYIHEIKKGLFSDDSFFSEINYIIKEISNKDINIFEENLAEDSIQDIIEDINNNWDTLKHKPFKLLLDVLEKMSIDTYQEKLFNKIVDSFILDTKEPSTGEAIKARIALGNLFKSDKNIENIPFIIDEIAGVGDDAIKLKEPFNNDSHYCPIITQADYKTSEDMKKNSYIHILFSGEDNEYRNRMDEYN